MSIKIGILSDTHLSGPSQAFRDLANRCFRDVDIILHAGDLTDLSVLSVFQDREVHAVCGNMCRSSARQCLPAEKEITVGDYRIGLVHKAGISYDFEDRLLEVFPEADCIVYGHTHTPVCRRAGNVLYINPGSFNSHGTYALLEVGDTLKAGIYEVEGKKVRGLE